ncbi:MAG TPA: hypothetical protein VFK37_00205 [Bacillales bacterium]|nr:hypothetical protein [Bacillales bacterium]
MRASVLLALLFSIVHVDHVDLNLQDDEVAFTYFDLPDGEATLIQNDEKTILVNTGSEESRSALFKRLSIYGVKKIDKLVITNSSAPYTDNISEVLKRFKVDTLLTSEAILKRLDLELPKQRIQVLKQGQSDKWLSGLKVLILRETESDTDEAALVIKFQYGKESVLYMGWADPEMEKSLENDARIDCNIIKVGDFAIENGSTTSFLHQVNPQVAIIFHRKGKLPNKEILGELDTVWIDAYRTHQIGTVSIKLNGESYQITTIPIEEYKA